MIIMCGGRPSSSDLIIVAEFRDFLRARREKEVSESPRGTDVGAPELNAEWPGELDTEEYRDPLGEDESSD